MQAGYIYQNWRLNTVCWWQSDSLQFKVVPCWTSRCHEIKADLPLTNNTAPLLNLCSRNFVPLSSSFLCSRADQHTHLGALTCRSAAQALLFWCGAHQAALRLPKSAKCGEIERPPKGKWKAPKKEQAFLMLPGKKEKQGRRFAPQSFSGLSLQSLLCWDSWPYPAVGVPSDSTIWTDVPLASWPLYALWSTSISV